MNCALGIESKKSLPRSNMFYPLYYPRYTIVLDFTFRSMTNFELWWTFDLILGLPGWFNIITPFQDPQSHLQIPFYHGRYYIHKLQQLGCGHLWGAIALPITIFVCYFVRSL